MGDAISGKLILEGIDKVGTLAALAIQDRDLKSLINTEIPTIQINRINEISVIDKLKALKIDLLVNFNSSIIFSIKPKCGY